MHEITFLLSIAGITVSLIYSWKVWSFVSDKDYDTKLAKALGEWIWKRDNNRIQMDLKVACGSERL